MWSDFGRKIKRLEESRFVNCVAGARGVEEDLNPEGITNAEKQRVRSESHELNGEVGQSSAGLADQLAMQLTDAFECAEVACPSSTSLLRDLAARCRRPRRAW